MIINSPKAVMGENNITRVTYDEAPQEAYCDTGAQIDKKAVVKPSQKISSDGQMSLF